jgi:hypothetical protein
MTAKTTLVQLHHKIQTFEAINKRLTLVIQDCFLHYLRDQFQFSHLHQSRSGDSMQIHAYTMAKPSGTAYRLELTERLSTDSQGIAVCLGLKAGAKVELREIIQQIESKLTDKTRFEL